MYLSVHTDDRVVQTVLDLVTDPKPASEFQAFVEELLDMHPFLMAEVLYLAYLICVEVWRITQP